MTPLAFGAKVIRPVHRQKNLYSHVLGFFLILGLLLATAEAATRLQANQYSEVTFKYMPHGPHPSKEFEFTVPAASVATLRLTELGCPGNIFFVTSGTKVLFRTSLVPRRFNCRNPLHIASASDAFADPYYSKGSIDLPAGDYTVRVTPFTGTSAAAIGFFIKRPFPVPTLGGSTTSQSPPTWATTTTAVETTSSEPETTETSEATTVEPETTFSSAREPTTTDASATATPEPETSTASDLTTSSEPESTTVSSAETTTFEPWTSTAETTAEVTTLPTEPETSDFTTPEPETSTTAVSETTSVVASSSSAEVTETGTSELPTSSVETATPEPTEASSTTETASPSATTDGATSTPSVPTPVASCSGQSRYLTLVTDPSYLFNDAVEACGAFGSSLAKISTFKERKDARNILRACAVEHAWIKTSSANTVNIPKCYAVTQDTSYEPEDCEHETMQVLCATP